MEFNAHAEGVCEYTEQNELLKSSMVDKAFQISLTFTKEF